jgi:hypothetical protein
MKVEILRSKATELLFRVKKGRKKERQKRIKKEIQIEECKFIFQVLL